MKHLCTDVYAASNTSCVKNQTIFDKKLANIKIELTKMEREISKTVCFYLFIYLFEKHLLGNDGMMTKYISKRYFLSKSQLMLFFVFLFLLLLLLLSFFLGGVWGNYCILMHCKNGWAGESLVDILHRSLLKTHVTSAISD